LAEWRSTFDYRDDSRKLASLVVAQLVSELENVTRVKPSS